MKNLIETLRNNETRPQDDWQDIAGTAADAIEEMQELIYEMFHIIKGETKTLTTEEFNELMRKVSLYNKDIK